MTLDSDLLDVHLHAAQVTPAGVRMLLNQMQRERDVARKLFGLIEDQVSVNDGATNAEMLHDSMTNIRFHLNELPWGLNQTTINYRDLLHA